MSMNFQSLFNPKTIAVVGASREHKKLGYRIFKNCQRYGYRGRVYPVNPKAKVIEQSKCYPTLSSVPKHIDLVIIATPAVTVPTVLTDAVRAKVGSVVVISAGFGESGAQGKALEKKVLDIAKKARLPLVGPNCLGVVYPHLKLNASFADGMPATGGVSVLSQSGAIAVAQMDWAAIHELGFRSIISLGNKTSLSEADLLVALAADKGTRVILLYLEDVRDGRRFLQVAQRVASQKPIIILRSGRSAQGAKAAQSHTGALAGSSQLTDSAFRQAGCVVVDTIADWLNFAAACDQLPRPHGNRLCILTNAGGPGILATDALAGTSLSLGKFSARTNRLLHNLLPPAASLHNPIDVIGDAPAERYLAALKIIIADPNIDMVVATITDQLTTRSQAIAKGVIALSKKNQKPILTSFIGGKRIATATHTLRKAGIPTFPFPDVAVQAADVLLVGTRSSGITVRPVPKPAKAFQFSTLTAVGEQARKFLKVGGIKVLPTYKIKTGQQAVKVAERLRYPVVMKIDSPKILHKTEKGGVIVDLHTAGMVKTAFSKMQKRFRAELKNQNSSLVLQDQRFGGLELIIGAIQDSQFGPVVVMGIGGILVEAIRKVNYICAPIDKLSATKFLESSSVWPILKGVRGQTFAVNKLAEVLIKVSNFIAKHADVKSLDLNPVLVGHDQAFILDGRIEFFK